MTTVTPSGHHLDLGKLLFWSGRSLVALLLWFAVELYRNVQHLQTTQIIHGTAIENLKTERKNDKERIEELEAFRNLFISPVRIVPRERE